MAARGSEQYREALDGLLRVIARELVRQYREGKDGDGYAAHRINGADTHSREGSAVPSAARPVARTRRTKC